MGVVAVKRKEQRGSTLILMTAMVAGRDVTETEIGKRISLSMVTMLVTVALMDVARDSGIGATVGGSGTAGGWMMILIGGNLDLRAVSDAHPDDSNLHRIR
jgi:hypothetical protein